MSLLLRAADILARKPEAEISRHPEWSRASKEFIERHGECRACGRKTALTTHHIMPVHLFPAEEMEPDNWIVLCSHWVKSRFGLVSCHAAFGHFGLFTDWNPNCRDDVERFRYARLNRHERMFEK